MPAKSPDFPVATSKPFPRWHLPLLLAAVSCTTVHSQSPDEKPLTDTDRKHWAFQPPRRAVPPTTRDADWVRTPVDAFVLAKLEAESRRPMPASERRAWLRRVYLDVVGLPPSPEDQDKFLTDTSPLAAEKVVDRLLTSPLHGERWAHHWLDAVRFAESNGYEMDADRPHAWRYRDYVAASLNADKPYDRFLREQLAGDELAKGKEPREVADLLVAVGLHRAGPVHLVGGNTDAEELRQESLTEYVQGVGSAILGMTINCARCHDHKFDPVSQADYYRLQAFFAAAEPREVKLGDDDEERQARAAQLLGKIAGVRREINAIDAKHRPKIRKAKLAKLEPVYRDALAVPEADRTSEQKRLAGEADTLLKVSWDEILTSLSEKERDHRAGLRRLMHHWEAQVPPPPPAAWTMGNADTTPPTRLLKRGEVKRKGPVVEPAFPRIIAGDPKQVSTRTDLADWITRPDHPLTARVIVNRIWQHYFGVGLVATPNDFGVRGAKPSNPELLDWLACELVKGGWRLKSIHRLILLSSAYAQSTKPRRLEGEAIRDSMLAAAGTLNLQVGGPSVRVELEPESYELIFTEGEPDGLWLTTPEPEQHTRRSLYLFAKRNVRLPLLEAFDQPDRLMPCAIRDISTYAPQALILMNGPFAREQSQRMAGSLLRAGGDPVDLAYRRALGRPPTDRERGVARDFLAGQSELVADRLRSRLPVSLPDNLPATADLAQAAALADFCLALFNSNEFVHVR